MSDNKITLFHVLSASAANNGKMDTTTDNNESKNWVNQNEHQDFPSYLEEVNHLYSTPENPTQMNEATSENVTTTIVEKADQPNDHVLLTEEQSTAVVPTINERYATDSEVPALPVVRPNIMPVESTRVETRLPEQYTLENHPSISFVIDKEQQSQDAKEQNEVVPFSARTIELSDGFEQEKVEYENVEEEIAATQKIDAALQDAFGGSDNLGLNFDEEEEEFEEFASNITEQTATELIPSEEVPPMEIEESSVLTPVQEPTTLPIDDPENFETDDIDEAYRKRLAALGLEQIAPLVEEDISIDSEPSSITDNNTAIDDELSKAFDRLSEMPSINETYSDTVAPTIETPLSPPETANKGFFSPLDFSTDEPLEPNLSNVALDEPNNTAASSSSGKSKKSMLQQFRQLQDRNSTFVFMFGRQQAGKTVILSSLAYHMGVDPEGVLETRRRQDNIKGAHYLKQLSQSVRKGEFMNRTAVGSLYELDLTYTPNKPNVPMNFTFLEMSGEDLSKVELSETSAGELPQDIDVYLQCPDLDLVFMMVVPYDDAEEHDYFVIDFLDFLKERKPDLDYSKVLLLISKWDRYEGLRKDEVDLFVKEQMPRTFSRLKAKKAKIARYSIGEVSEDNQHITQLNTERPEAVKRWLYNAVTGYRIKEQGEQGSFWNKLKKWV